MLKRGYEPVLLWCLYVVFYQHYPTDMNLKERIPCSRNNDSLSSQMPSTAKQSVHVKRQSS